LAVDRNFLGGGSADPNSNFQLAAVIKKARDQDVPKDNIERAFERAEGKNKKGEVVTYEALAFDSVGIIIESLTDNLNRTIANLREIFNDHGFGASLFAYLSLIFVEFRRLLLCGCLRKLVGWT